MSEQLQPSNPEALQRCRLNLGCTARNRCVAAPVREGVTEVNDDVRTVQKWADIEAAVTGERKPLDDNQVETIESQADFLETLRGNLAGCGYLLLRLEDHPETA